MGRLADGVGLLATLVRIVYEEEIRYPAAALAYYGFVSFVPLLLLIFAVLGQQVAQELAVVAPRFLTPRVQQLVDRSLRTAAGQTGAGVLAVLVLTWSSVNVVGDVRAVVRRIEGPTDDTVRGRLTDGVAILGSLALAILAIVVTTYVFEFPGSSLAVGVGGFLGLWVALSIAFVPLYAVPSSVVESPADAFPGAAVAALGWAALHMVVQFYVVRAGRYAVYGVLSGVIIILTSLYVAAALLLTGIIVNAWVTPNATIERG